MTAPPLRQRLKAETSDVHERLHEHQDFAAIANGSILSQDFDRIMAHVGGFYAALDPAMMSASRKLGSKVYQYRPGRPLFTQVVKQGGGIPTIDTLAALAGAAYVVDGAVLGGQILRRALSGRLSHPYWDWCANHGATVWREARMLIDLADTNEAAADHAVQTANAVFHEFERYVSITKEKASA